MDERLLETLRDAQRFGFFGDRPVDEAARHSSAFVDALGPIPDGSRLVDLGSGGGLPGLVLAEAYRQVSVTLVDRRQKRTDFLQRAVLRLGWDHVHVVAGDVEDLARRVTDGTVPAFDAVTARGFGPPGTTLALAVELVAQDGRIVISEPPHDDRWDPELLASLGVSRNRIGPVSVFTPV